MASHTMRASTHHVLMVATSQRAPARSLHGCMISFSATHQINTPAAPLLVDSDIQSKRLTGRFERSFYWTGALKRTR